MRAIAVARMRVDAEALSVMGKLTSRERVDKHRDSIKVDNLMTVPSLSLLRCWGNSSRATYESMWRHYVVGKQKKFLFDVNSVEVGGTAL